MKHYVYKHWDKDGVLLYVGCSKNLKQRSCGHYNSRWFDEIDKITSKEFETKLLAMEAEKNSIQEESPVYNIMHHPNRPPIMQMPQEPPLSKNGTLGIEGVKYRISKACYDAGGIEKWAKKNRKSWSHIYAVLRGEMAPPDWILRKLRIDKVFIKKEPKVDSMANVCYD